MSKVRKDIPYVRAASPRETGDLYLPAGTWRGKVLVIHGGGWHQYSKERMAGVARLLADHGYASFAVNYPLITDQPWPACGEACLAAGRFLQALAPAILNMEGSHHVEAAPSPLLAALSRGGGAASTRNASSRAIFGDAALAPPGDDADAAGCPLFTLGASAGGHLALLTGLRLGGVAGIVSIAGVTDVADYAAQPGFAEQKQWFVKAFLGTDTPSQEQWQATSPLNSIRAGQPPLFISHDRNDKVVPVEQAETLAAASHRVGGKVDFYRYDGPGHLMWVDPQPEAPRLLPAIEERLLAFLERCDSP